MRIARMLALALVVGVMALSTTANAQTTGYVAVYFDQGLSQEQAFCPGEGTLDTVYVAAVGWNTFVKAAQYKINFPPELAWAGDFDLPAVYFGTSATGISLAFPFPQNGFFPLNLHKTQVVWHCDNCNTTDIPVSVVGHPLLGNTVSIIDIADEQVDGVGLTALICPTVPTEETTWGSVKALYGE